jgi:hypothetical protein
MRLSISCEGAHDCADNPNARWHMVVDGHGFLIDLDNVRNSIVDPGSLTDPSVRRVEWGPVRQGGEVREGGVITRQDGSQQTFFDRHLLNPYLALYEKRKAELAAA